MRAYERVTIRTDRGTTRTVYLEEPAEVPFLGTVALTGRRVNREGESPLAEGDIREVIDTTLITKRTAMRMNHHYGWLEVSRG